VTHYVAVRRQNDALQQAMGSLFLSEF
jgi:hypothetical protein